MKPQRLQPTRVYRFYCGGALLGRIRGTEEEDGSFPEDWVCSVTPASNPGRTEPDAGLSRLADGRLLREAISRDPEAWLGPAHLDRFGETTGLLVKLLDPAERVLVHAHPDRAFAAAHLGSPFGKTEAWIVIATRESEGEAFVGLRVLDRAAGHGCAARLAQPGRAPSRGRRLRACRRPARDRRRDADRRAAGAPDFSLICEWKGFPVRPEDAHLGLGWETALRALDLRAHEPMRRLREEAAAFFWADELVEPAGRFSTLIMLEGQGELDGEKARRGDVFAVPASVEQLDWSGSLRVLRCLAPDPELA